MMKIDERDMLIRIDEKQIDIEKAISKIEEHMAEQNGRIGKGEIKVALIMGVGGAIVGILAILTMLKELII